MAIDIHIDMPAVKYRELRDDAGDDASDTIRARLVKARERQVARYQGERIHASAYCTLTPDCEQPQESAVSYLGLSAPRHDRILTVDRTIADLKGTDTIGNFHISEASHYRSLDRNYWA